MKDNLKRYQYTIRLPIIILALIVMLIPSFIKATDHINVGEEIGNLLPIWSCIPFVGMLLSLAIFPLIKPVFWERNLFNISIIWGAVFLIPYAFVMGAWDACYEFFHIILLDYMPFIILLWGLFVVSGGIVIKGSLRGSPKGNLIFLLIGTVLASWIGTTGASMLMIRPLLHANKWREKRAHVVIFFIFLVSNIGGCLTPIGDPPLFLGFLRGVPFLWTMNLLPMLIMNAAILLFLFYLIDKKLYKNDIRQGRKPDDDSGIKLEPLRIQGSHNFVFIAMIVGAVILSGILGKIPALQDDLTGAVIGIPFAYDIVVPINNVVQEVLIIIAGVLSLITTKKELHKLNRFSWEPIKEVACLFIGIFITVIPVLAILSARGTELGLTEPWQFFWVTGTLSSFLDNAPTYLVFMTTAAAIPTTTGITTTVGVIAPKLLMAVSAGAVFMGANTYIGNAPNFMVRSIAIEDGVSMPSFLSYMAWSGRYLIPLFILNTIIFF